MPHRVTCAHVAGKLRPTTVKLATTSFSFVSSKARDELGYAPMMGSAAALKHSAAFYLDELASA